MKNEVVSYEKNGIKVVYLNPIPMSSKYFSNEYRTFRKSREMGTDRTLFDIQHRLRVKVVIYGCIFQTYDPGMDFTNMINAGWEKTT